MTEEQPGPIRLGRLALVTLALLVDAFLLLGIAPVAIRWASLSAVGLSGCNGVGCEGPLIVFLLLGVPGLWSLLTLVYVVASIRRGRTPAMTLLKIPAHSRRPSGLTE